MLYTLYLRVYNNNILTKAQARAKFRAVSCIDGCRIAPPSPLS